MFKTYLKLKVTGRNIERFLKRLNDFNIDIKKITYLKYNEIYIVIDYKYYDDLMKIKTTYDVLIEEEFGFKKIIKVIKKYRLIFIMILLSFLFVFFLSNMIFEINVIHEEESLRTMLLEELKDYDIKLFSLKKNYNYLEKVKKDILKKHEQELEWLEIEVEGTTYNIRVVEKKLNQKKITSKPRNIVAKKDAIITKIDATSGEVLKTKNDYVKKNDVVISGNINLYEETKKRVSADGHIYGEVWYKVTVEYPLNYQAEVLKDIKQVYGIRILSKEIYKKDKLISKRNIFKHLFLPFELNKYKVQEVKYENRQYSIQEATLKALDFATEKMKSKLSEKEYIIDRKKLKVEQNNSKIIIEVFFSVCEDITDYELIEGE